MNIPRFRIIQDGDIEFRCNELYQIIQWLQKSDMSLNTYYVDDIQDDIEVSADDLMASWNEGERYEDLQAF